MSSTHVDVLIVGAGLSGVGMAAQLSRLCPSKSYAVLERRDAIGGTWDYFRYPGIRCDSDMYTLGYAFRPWTGEKMISEADSIRTYIEETADEYGVTEHIRFGHRVVRASWSTADARWTVTALVEETGEEKTFTASFLVGCSGYYSYDEAHTPRFEGQESFEGEIVHAQFWDPDTDYAGKEVVVIGSGATAVTVVPAMAEHAHVTMLQRSPSYVLTLPSRDRTVDLLERFLPRETAVRLTRNRNTFLQFGIYHLARRFPGLVRKLLLAQVERQLEGAVDMKHFTPSYDPWDERLCAVPNGDLFEALREGRASVVTDHIARFTPEGIELQSGELLEADLVVLATGLKMVQGGGAEMVVDGEPVDLGERLTYRATMVADVPNFAMVFGYVNTSWTRKADLVFEYVCRLLRHMDRTGTRQVTPRGAEGHESDEPFVELKSGYVERGLSVMPKQGTEAPWRNTQNVFTDTLMLRYGRLEDGFLRFTNPAPKARREPKTRDLRRLWARP